MQCHTLADNMALQLKHHYMAVVNCRSCWQTRTVIADAHCTLTFLLPDPSVLKLHRLCFILYKWKYLAVSGIIMFSCCRVCIVRRWWRAVYVPGPTCTASSLCCLLIVSYTLIIPCNTSFLLHVLLSLIISTPSCDFAKENTTFLCDLWFYMVTLDM